MSVKYFPYVGRVDVDRNPHLAEAARQVEILWDSIFPWTWLRWHRAHKIWKREIALHEQLKNGRGGEEDR